MARVLIVDDEPKLGRLVAEMLRLDGHTVHHAGGGRDALVELAARPWDVVVTDLRMPEVDGMAVLVEARRRTPAPAVVMVTAHGSTESAVAAMKEGAADYLTKPISMDELRLRVRRLAERGAAERRAQSLLARLTPSLVADSPAMAAVMAAARKVAPSSTTVLLLGETGTGKSQLAQLIHFESGVATGPFVEVHCAALPETLLEGELFGHEKGAFTGADSRQTGHLAAAEGGTLFLDEIGEVTPATQLKLLRFLQDRSFVPLGSTAPRQVNVRLVAATNRDLDEAVRTGAFREDFYYRLNVFTIVVPPLRERREDILPLADGLLARHGLPPAKLSGPARDRLLTGRWPGNVRELENVLERALILSGDGAIGPEHVKPAGVRARTAAADLIGEEFDLDIFERELLEAALERAGGNKTTAARLLGITRRRLYSRLQSLAREPDDPEDKPSG